MEGLTLNFLQLAMVTHFVDASWVYGSSDSVADMVRERSGGRLRVQRSPDGRLFPPNIPNPTHSCEVSSDNDLCYFGGKVYVSLMWVFIRTYCVRISIYQFRHIYNRILFSRGEKDTKYV